MKETGRECSIAECLAMREGDEVAFDTTRLSDAFLRPATIEPSAKADEAVPWPMEPRTPPARLH
ncbi:MAG: hypothetical protein OXI55_09510 [Gammaproteobacteria bacterium]|nr:hypothetical protein [Gammaproteobacteria bacterium]